MGSVNYSNPATDTTVKVFDNFYRYAETVPAQEYDAVYSYWREQFDTAEAAGNFTVTTFRVASESGISVMDVLAQLQGKTPPEVTLTFAYYLNNLRSGSTLLGLNQPTQPNFYVARNVKA